MPTQIDGNRVFVSVKGFKKVNEFQSPEEIQDSELTVLENATLDNVAGEVVARSGFNSYNSYSANTSTETYGIVSMFESIVASSEYIFALIGTRLKSFKKNVAWVDQKIGLTVNKLLRYAQYTDKIYVTNGSEAPFIVDVKTGVSSSAIVGIVAPDISSTTFTPIGTSGSISFRGDFDASFGKFPENGNVISVTIAVGGTGYLVGNIITISGGGADCKLKVISIGSGGVVDVWRVDN